ncbi:endonuclease/exonuclease/phosphatase family protein [Oceanihabitans sp. IOP_32]|uniref:endonuclease/exonuclease/phosphatase family protein n=1 Tax=Oceanihabitans sp. IOP_32 TaxID=2529032 RepID=UPI0012936682|nr:endonuclease/exonuclease/phosphatase family protein [Oceanihabitans sp. IOP_32]QFZ54697.1 endonuclease/exonuclease/phosphatase family protein [Oceanihabitans sp. IOP_32]
MNILRLSISILFLSIITTVNSQEKKYKIHTIGFYNLENLFDTINDPNKFDEFSPIMTIKNERGRVYQKKIKNMARVIADIGKDITNNSPAIIGVSEVENRAVLEDLVNDSLLVSQDYGIVHYDSPDTRGIDVALLYQKKIFTPTHTSSHTLKIYDDASKERVYTRDQLLVSGDLDGETIHVMVNHWPSRRGGEARSRPKRMAAAKLSKRLIDSLQSTDPYAKIFIMGDLNDNPTDASVKTILKAEKDRLKVGLKGIYNPFEKLYKAGLGTNAFRDNWFLFDQIMMTKPLLEKDFSSFRFYKAGIFNKNYLTNKKGKYEGYPFRSFSSNTFTGGFSDHYPVYVYVIKEVSNLKN